MPLYINANFNGASFGEHSDGEITLPKTMIPGDLISFSVFVDLREILDIKILEIAVQNVPNWLIYMEGSAKISYADRAEEKKEGEIVQVTLDKYPCEIILDPPALLNDILTFTIDVPEKTGDHDGLCLDLDLYFLDTSQNQNLLINQTMRLRFVADKVA